MNTHTTADNTTHVSTVEVLAAEWSKLSPDKLAVLADAISYLMKKQDSELQPDSPE